MVARLRDSLNTIRQKNEELAALNTSLEERVERRTRQLEQKNFELTDEISRREQLEREIRRASEEATTQADNKARFMAMLSHELRTPLQSVLGVSALLSRQLPEKTDEFRLLDASAKSVLTLIDGVLSYAKLEAGKVTPVRSGFKVADVIDEAVRLATAPNESSGLGPKVTVHIANDVPARIRTDAGILRQLIVNLVANARRYAGDEAKIKISVKREPLPQKDDIPHNDFFLSVSVADNGPGIPEHARGRLFKPFEQVGQGSADPSRGSGLGLAICTLLTKALDGDIWLNESDSKGAEIVFRIGAEVDRTNEAILIPSIPDKKASVDASVAHAGQSLNILLVEDHAINLRLVSEMLLVLGHRVTGVPTGEEALDVFKASLGGEAERFDTVITDINLPGISGFDVARGIRTLCTAGGARVPVLAALTASADAGDAELARDAGIQVRLTKPATFASLEAALAETSLAIAA
jgi:two-component system, sensor histidine kinase RpfC